MATTTRGVTAATTTTTTTTAATTTTTSSSRPTPTQTPIRLISAIILGVALSIAGGAEPKALAAQPDFRGIGYLPGGGMNSQAHGVANTNTEGLAIGTAENPDFDTRAVIVHPTSGMLDLGTLGGAYSEGGDISADGAVAVGGAANAQSRQRPFRWTESTRMQDLGSLGGETGFATSTDFNGDVVAGWSLDPAARTIAFAWTANTGIIQNLGTLGGDRSMALGVSGDGRVIVGSSRTASGASHAFRFENGAMSDLGTLGGSSSQAEAANRDGSLIVGQASSAGGDQRPFIWSVQNGMRDLGVLPGGLSATAFDISGDGDRIVGGSEDKSFAMSAVMWIRGANGEYQVIDLNVAFRSIIPPGWLLERAESISADGRFIAGAGLNPNRRPEGWVLDLGQTSALRLIVAGECPGRMRFTAEGATPGGAVAFLAARGRGNAVIPPARPCAGAMLGLDDTARLIATRRADRAGAATLSATIPPNACGRTFIQALDLASCETGEVAPV